MSRHLWVAALALLVVGCAQDDQYPNRPILLICPWAQGGGTDNVSRRVALHLESELNVPVNVINATGGKGVTGHSRGLKAHPDGYTLMMATLELNTMHWIGLTSLTIDDCAPLMSINEDYAALLVRSDSPWETLQDLEQAIRLAPGKLTSSGTTAGGTWHLALAGWLIHTGLDAQAVNWIASTGAAPSLQELMSGGLDMVCCSLPEANALLESNQLRSLGVMAPQRAVGYEHVPTFAEQGSDWSMGGWRALVLPKATPEPIRKRLLAAIEKVVTGQTKIADTTFPGFMEQQRFDHTYRSGAELETFLADTDRKFGELLTSDAMLSVRQDPFSPMIFPQIIGALGLVVMCSLAWQRWRQDPVDVAQASYDHSAEHNVLAMVAVLAAILAYWLLAESMGFILISFLILLALMWIMRAPTSWAVCISVLFPIIVYQFFKHGLRVPLPRGWLGW